MTDRSEEVKIINDHKGETVTLSNGKTAKVRPFTVEELFSDELINASEKIIKTMWAQITPFITGGNAPTIEKLKKLDLIGAIRGCRKEMKYCFATCVDLPLTEIPAPELPLILGAFVRQNFSHAQMQSWADLLKSLATAVRAASKSASTSAMPASSSSITDIPAGGATPGPSSSTGSGGA